MKRSYPKWMQLNGATSVVTLVAASGLLFAVSPETVVTALSAGDVVAEQQETPVEIAGPASQPTDPPREVTPTSPQAGEPAAEQPPGGGESGDGEAGDADGSGGEELPGTEDEPQEPIAPGQLESSGSLRDEVESEVRSLTARATDAPYSFMLTQFNILGSNHTKPGADADHFAPGTVRTEWAVSYLERWGSDIIGFSEIQKDQLAVFNRSTGHAFDAWPGTALGAKGVPQTVVWRKSMFTATAKESVTIPFMGQQRPQPVVRLKHLATGREFWVMNVHNAPRTREAERDRATALELAVIEELRKTGTPVLFVGDMNEKEEIFCTVTGRTDLYSPRGGSNDGGCRPPRGMRVDWIFGSSDVQFSGYTDEKTAEVRRITDHGVLHSKVTIP